MKYSRYFLFVCLCSQLYRVEGIVECPCPPSPENGSVLSCEGSGKLYSWVTYHCNDGYSMVGEHERLCLSNGKWSGYAPTCRKRCTCPRRFQNGRTGYCTGAEGTTVTYQCNSGFLLVGGASIRRCSPGGVWTGGNLTCVKLRVVETSSNSDQGQSFDTASSNMINIVLGVLFGILALYIYCTIVFSLICSRLRFTSGRGTRTHCSNFPQDIQSSKTDGGCGGPSTDGEPHYQILSCKNVSKHQQIVDLVEPHSILLSYSIDDSQLSDDGLPSPTPDMDGTLFANVYCWEHPPCTREPVAQESNLVSYTSKDHRILPAQTSDIRLPFHTCVR